MRTRLNKLQRDVLPQAQWVYRVVSFDGDKVTVEVIKDRQTNQTGIRTYPVSALAGCVLFN